MKSVVTAILIFILALNLSAQVQTPDTLKPMVKQSRKLSGGITSSVFILYKLNFIIAVVNKSQIKSWRLSDGKTDIFFRCTKSNENIEEIMIDSGETKIFMVLQNIQVKNTSKSVFGFTDTVWKFETKVVCYSLSEKKLVWEAAPGTSVVNKLGLVNDSLLYVIGRDKSVFLKIKNGELVRKKQPDLKLSSDNIMFSHTGQLMLYWNRPGYKTLNLRIGSRLSVWDFQKDKESYSRYISGKGIWTASFMPEEDEIIIGNYDGTLKLWSTQRHTVSVIWKNDELQNEPNRIYKVFLPFKSNKFIGIHNFSNRLKVLVYPQLKDVFVLENVFANLSDNLPVAFSKDGSYLAIGSHGELLLYETSNWKLLWRIAIV